MWRLIASFVRRRAVLACIFLSSLSYFLIKTQLIPLSYLSNDDTELTVLQEYKITAHRHIQWIVVDAPTSNNDTGIDSFCRNTKQGFICNRRYLMSNGCCDSLASSTDRFQCTSCSADSGCCSSFEGCVSCCLRPDKKDLLLNMIESINGHRLRQMQYARDQFELCLLKCRTSSNSVHSENKYKSQSMKYCYKEESTYT